MRTKITSVLKLLIICILTGAVSGVLGALFAKGISFVTGLRHDNPWLIYLLPIAGIATAAIYKLLKVSGMGTDHVIESADGRKTLSRKLVPAVFVSSILSHLCGASVGKEGAALQLGGSSALFISRLFKFEDKHENILIHCGMAGVFASVFGTPLAAAAFALEVIFVCRINYRAAVPVFITSFASYFTAHLLGAHAERFAIGALPALEFSVIWKVALLGVMAIAVGLAFCLALKYSKKLFKRLFKNTFLRIAVGGIITVLLTLALGTYDYNGSGIEIIEGIFGGSDVPPYAFALKLLFTCIAVGAGFKGGEIVPTLFIGAAFGAFAGSWLGLPPSFAAPVTMTAVFCCATNCPIASLFLAAELFSWQGMGYIAIAVVISYLLSGKLSLYGAQQSRSFKAWF